MSVVKNGVKRAAQFLLAVYFTVLFSFLSGIGFWAVFDYHPGILSTFCPAYNSELCAVVRIPSLQNQKAETFRIQHSRGSEFAWQRGVFSADAKCSADAERSAEILNNDNCTSHASGTKQTELSIIPLSKSAYVECVLSNAEELGGYFSFFLKPTYLRLGITSICKHTSKSLL